MKYWEELWETIENVEEIELNDKLSLNVKRVNNEVPEYKKIENNEDEICDIRMKVQRRNLE